LKDIARKSFVIGFLEVSAAVNDWKIKGLKKICMRVGATLEMKKAKAPILSEPSL
jgi:peptidyl-tRNA hydrolase